MKLSEKQISKFKAIATEKDGIKFHSRLESRYYEQLKLLEKAGDVVFFLRQVPFHLSGGVKYIVDFVVFWENGQVDFVDVKGFETALFKTKKKLVESQYPIKIKVVTHVR